MTTTFSSFGPPFLSYSSESLLTVQAPCWVLVLGLVEEQWLSHKWKLLSLIFWRTTSSLFSYSVLGGPPPPPPSLRSYLLFRQLRARPSAIWSSGEYPPRLQARPPRGPKLVPPAQGPRVGVFRGRKARRSARGKWMVCFVLFQCQSVSSPTSLWYLWHGKCMAWPWKRPGSSECHVSQGKLLAPPERPLATHCPATLPLAVPENATNTCLKMPPSREAMLLANPGASPETQAAETNPGSRTRTAPRGSHSPH
jgi:hypothetical protein